MPKFNKKETDLENHFDKWLYFFKNLNDFSEIPNILKEPVFRKAFREAEIANMKKVEYNSYQESLKKYNDVQCVMDSAFNKGKLEGKLESKLEGIIEGVRKEKILAAKTMKNKGFKIQDISEITGLSLDEIISL